MSIKSFLSLTFDEWLTARYYPLFPRLTFFSLKLKLTNLSLSNLNI